MTTITPGHRRSAQRRQPRPDYASSRRGRGAHLVTAVRLRCPIRAVTAESRRWVAVTPVLASPAGHYLPGHALARHVGHLRRGGGLLDYLVHAAIWHAAGHVVDYGFRLLPWLAPLGLIVLLVAVGVHLSRRRP